VISRANEKVDVLFVCEHALWPLHQGSCVHGYRMATALSDSGVRVGLASHAPTPDSAPNRMRQMAYTWPVTSDDDYQRFLHAWRGLGYFARRRIARFQGRDLRLFAGLIPLVKQVQPSVVVALGQHGAMMLHGLRDFPAIQRVWYAADDPVYFQASCMRRESISHWPSRLSKMALYAAIEKSFARCLDGVIAVSPFDARLLRLNSGVRRTVTIRNGVDLNYFNPVAADSSDTNSHSLIFWGRLDFEPNVDAVKWFARQVWPALRWYRPDATWQIVGKNPHPEVLRLARLPGVQLIGAVDDLRPYAIGAAVTIVPTRCGGGIKNKLLEAAAMARPMVVSSRAISGLIWEQHRPPFLECTSSDQWVKAIRKLWSNPQLALSLSHNARVWAQRHHSWPKAAQSLIEWLESYSNGTVLRNVPSPGTMTKHQEIPNRVAA